MLIDLHAELKGYVHLTSLRNKMKRMGKSFPGKKMKVRHISYGGYDMQISHSIVTLDELKDFVENVYPTFIIFNNYGTPEYVKCCNELKQLYDDISSGKYTPKEVVLVW